MRRKLRLRAAGTRWLRAALPAAFLGLMLASGAVLASGANSQREINAAGGTQADGSDGLHLWWGSNSQFQVVLGNKGQVYSPGGRPTAGALFNSVYLRVDRGHDNTNRIYHNSNTNSNVGGYAAFTQVSQSAVSGSGTALSPWQVTTVLRPSNSADSAITVTIVDRYVYPQSWFTRRVTLSGMPTSGAAIKFYQNIDTYLDGGDQGPGFTRTSPWNLSSTPDVVGVQKDAQIEALWHEPSSGTPLWDRYFSGTYLYPGRLICNGTTGTSGCTTGTGNLNNAIDTNSSTDNGIAAQWNVPAGASSHTVEYRVTFAMGAVDLTKAFAPATINAGEVSTLSFTLTNRTFNSVASINLTDTLPAGVVVAPTPNVRTSCPSGAAMTTVIPPGMSVSAAVGAGSIQVSGASIVGAPSGGQISCRISVDVTSSVVGQHTNDSSNISGTNNLVNLVGNEVLTVVQPQLTASKSVGGTLLAGQTGAAADGHYLIGLANTGTGPTTAAIDISDTLPAGFSAVAVSSPDGSVSCGGLPATGTLNCSFTPAAPIAAGANASIRVNVAIDASATGDVTNVVAIAGGGDPDPLPTCPAAGNPQCAQVTSTLDTSADVSITKSNGASTYVPGASTVYTVVVANAGPSAASNVQVQDTAPAGTTLTGWTCTGVACPVASGSGNLNHTLPVLAAGASVSYALTVQIDSDTSGSITNTATATSTTPDPNAANNSASDTDTAAPSADVAISKSLASPNPAVPGQTLTWTLTATNNGPSDAPMTTADAVPATVTGLSVGGADGGACSVAGQNVDCDFGTVPSGQSRSYTISGTLAAGATGSLANTATVSTTATDPTPGNNSATSTTPVQATADIAVNKILTTAGPYVIGQTVAFDIVVSNVGPSEATGVQVTDTPSNLTLTSVSGACTALPCTIASIASGGSVTITVQGTIDAEGAFGNSATATPTETDPDGGNNTGTDGDDTTPTADIAVSKTLTTAGPYVIGQTVAFDIVVSNVGPSEATGVQVTDTPSNLTLTSVSGACTALPCTIASIASGSSTTITVQGTIDAEGAFGNSATATPTETDPDGSNNTGTDGDDTTPTADVSVSKTLTTAGPYVIGQTVAFDIVVSNAGPSEATGVQVSDTPSNLTLTSVSGACTALPCTIASIASGGTATITVHGTIDAEGAFGNSATATPTETDPDGGNNTGTDGDDTTPTADIAVSKTLTTAGPYVIG
ncbi:DUF11 domain-containing protein, partial [Lysobacter maris]